MLDGRELASVARLSGTAGSDDARPAGHADGSTIRGEAIPVRCADDGSAQGENGRY